LTADLYYLLYQTLWPNSISFFECTNSYWPWVGVDSSSLWADSQSK